MAEWAANDPAATPLLSSSPTAITGAGETPAASVTMLQRMAEFGLVFDPTIPFCERTCSLYGATKPDDITLDKMRGQLYSEGNSAQPVPVCLLCRASIVAVGSFLHCLPTWSPTCMC